ncbi:MAG: nucleoside triphosphate pyrophosphohydrolase [Chitinophagaceae bacterium]
MQRLVTIMEELREKCPWDRKQTIQTLRQLTIEETFELADAITDNDWQSIKEELGDILLHLVFYSKIGEEQQQFTLQDVIDSICKKLINRHPHIYNTSENHLGNAITAEDVKRNWEQIKLNEARVNEPHGNKANKRSLLSGVPKSLPAMVKAMRLQEKAKHVGFEWETKEQVWQKIKEEEQELLQAVQSKKQSDIEEEMGDLFFSIINYARFLDIDAENALELTNKKFIKRFTQMEAIAKADGKNLESMNLEEMDKMWDNIKQQMKNN